MTPQPQLNKRDCLRAGIASLLGLPSLSVPDFMEDAAFFETLEEGPDGATYPRWFLRLQTWLHERGLAYVEIVAANGARNTNPLPFPAHALIIGKKNGTRHTVVGRIGTSLEWIHDPSPGEGGLDVVGAIAYLVPIDPERIARTEAALEQIIVLAGQQVLSPEVKREIVEVAKGALGRSLIELQKPRIVTP